MSIAWHRDNSEGTAWSATIDDGQEGWFAITLELDPDGWRWIINHDRAFCGQERTLEQAKAAASAQCEIRPFTENEGDGYLVTFSDFPGVVASGATPEEAIHHGRDALDAYRRTPEELESTSHA